jgi:hypothetical protein
VRIGLAALVGLLTLASGCIPVRSTRTARDVVLSRHARTAEPTSPPTGSLAIVETSARGVRFQVDRSSLCRHVEIEAFETRTSVAHEPDPVIHVGAYIVAAALAGAGVAVLVDAPSVADGMDPRVRNPVGADGAVGIGIGLSLGGLAALAYGVAASIEDADEVEVDEPGTRETRSEMVTCHAGPAEDVRIEIEVRERGDTITRRSLGRTDASGSLAVDLIEAIGDEIAEGRSLFIVAGGSTRAIETEPLLPAAEASAWTRGTGVVGTAALREFLAAFPHGAHAAEARTRLRETRVPELRTEIDEAFAGDDLAALNAAIAELRSLAPDEPFLADADARLAARREAEERARAEAGAAWFDGLVATGPFRVGMSRRAAERACIELGGTWDGSSSRLASCGNAPVHLLGVYTSAGWAVGLTMRGGRVSRLGFFQSVAESERMARDLRARIEAEIGRGADRSALGAGTAHGWFWRIGDRLVDLTYVDRLLPGTSLRMSTVSLWFYPEGRSSE